MYYGFISIKNMWLYFIEIIDLVNFVFYVYWKIKNVLKVDVLDIYG